MITPDISNPIQVKTYIHQYGSWCLEPVTCTNIHRSIARCMSNLIHEYKYSQCFFLLFFISCFIHTFLFLFGVEMSYCLIPNLTPATVWQSVKVMRFLHIPVPGVWKKQTYLRNHSHSLDCSLASVEKPKYTKVKCMQRSGTEAIRTKLQRSKPKREITNSQNTKRTHGQSSKQLFPKR